MKVARVLGAVGRVMITAGTLILLFVAYELWGTGVHTAQAQDNARDEIERQTDAYRAEHPDPRPPRPGHTQPVPDAPPRGEPIGIIQIPAIGVNKVFFEGVELDVLSSGPGHYEGTPLPGQEGNAGIAGHRTTYGAPFNRIDELGEGDEIVISYANGSRFTYLYNSTVIVAPGRTDVLEYKFDNRLTLTSCNPKYSAAERIVVSATLQERAAPYTPLPEAGHAVVRVDDSTSIDGQTHP
ncbi:MAG TPA: class E sortase, partial [Acidimicrobiales bacterium]